jgi:hypothetical protein
MTHTAKKQKQEAEARNYFRPQELEAKVKINMRSSVTVRTLSHMDRTVEAGRCTVGGWRYKNERKEPMEPQRRDAGFPFPPLTVQHTTKLRARKSNKSYYVGISQATDCMYVCLQLR